MKIYIFILTILSIFTLPDSILNFSRNATTIAAILLAGYILFRSRTPQILKDELEITRQSRDRFKIENEEIKEAGHKKDIEIAELKGKTNLNTVMDSQTKILESITKFGTDMVTALTAHQVQDSQMFGQFTVAIQELSSTLKHIDKKIKGE